MARIIIAPPNSGGPELEVDQDRFDAGFFHGYVYVRDATPQPSSEVSAEESRFAGLVSGGTVLPAALRAAFVRPRGPRLATLTDSISGFGAGYPYYAAVLSKQQISVTTVNSFVGYTSAQLLALIGTATSDPAENVILGAGTNDATGSVPIATYIANMTAMITAVRSAGKNPILVTCPPLGPPATSAQSKTVQAMNTWLRRYSQANRLVLVDMHAALVDPATGSYVAAYDSGDGKHPSAAGQAVMGQTLATALAPLLPPALSLANLYSGGNNLLSNSAMLTDSNTDGLPDGYTLSGAPITGVAASLVADPLGFNWQRFTLSGATTAVKSAGLPNPTTGFAPGDTLKVSCRMRSGQAGTSNFFVAFYTAGYAQTISVVSVSGPISNLVQKIPDGVAYREIVVPANAAIIGPGYGFGGADGTYDYALPTIENLTALGVA